LRETASDISLHAGDRQSAARQLGGAHGDTNKTTGATKTVTDPGRALVTGK